MQEKVAAKLRTGCFDAIKHHKKLSFATKVEKLARDLARFVRVVTGGEVRRGICVMAVVLRNKKMPPPLRPANPFVQAAPPTPAPFVFFFSAKLFFPVLKPPNIYS